MVIINLS